MSTIWFNGGLFLSLCVITMAFEWRSYIEPVDENFDRKAIQLDDEPPITILDPPKQPKPKVIKPIEVKNNDPEVITPPDFSLDIDEPIIDIPVFSPPEEPAPEPPLNLYEVEIEPMPVGGFEKFYEFVRDNIKYPSKARSLGIEGKVFAQFVIDQHGNVTNVEILRGIGAGCDEEVLRIMNMAPKWNPGKQRGKAVKVKMVLPINFEIGK